MEQEEASACQDARKTIGITERILKIQSVIHEKYKETEIHVCKDRMDEEVRGILGELHTLYDEVIAGVDEAGNRCTLRPAEILSFYAEGQRVIMLGADRRYTVSRKLYELEEQLGSCGFVRISKSEIVNFRQIRSLDMSITGTVRVIMKNGYETYASRRNVTKIKEMLRKEKGV